MGKTNRKVPGAEPAGNGSWGGGELVNGNTCSKNPVQPSLRAPPWLIASVSPAGAARRCTGADQYRELTHGLRSVGN